MSDEATYTENVGSAESIKGRIIRTPWLRHLVTFLVVAGPGLIVMEADNDAGAVSTYVQAGAQYGTHLLWTMLLLLPITYFIQEMVVRLGIATGKGHAAMIYGRFGKWWGRFSLLACSLITLRAYLILMGVMLLYHVLDLAGCLAIISPMSASLTR
jgi:Mn2+/Fe2+ NRAMP family transporter